MISNIVFSMIIALSLTVIIEIGISYLLKIREKIDIVNIILINCITNPTINCIMLIINYIFDITKTSHILLVLILEMLVVYTEYKYYKKHLMYKGINLLTLSAILNASSFFLGYIILKIFN